jgi:hypothetical protein
MNQCPRYSKCSANLCPLDAGLARRNHVQGERICFYLTEAVKKGAAARFKARAIEDIYLAAVKMLSEAVGLVSDVQKKLRDAAKSGSQMERTRHLATPAEVR